MISPVHALRQGPVVAALVKTAIAATRAPAATMPPVPGPEHTASVTPRPEALVRDYLLHVGADPKAYAGVLPAHLFPQWGFPLQSRTLEGLPYDLKRVLNGGCRLEIHRQLPMGEPLELRSRLAAVDDDGRRAILSQEIVTGTASAPDAVKATVVAIVPLPATEGAAREKKARPTVPADDREIARWKLGRNAGLEFAVLTGDFNPVHWIPPYARMFGFKSTILHGFATMARAVESVNRVRFAGDIDRIAVIDVQFRSPLVLPASPGVYLGEEDDGRLRLTVGNGPGGPAFLTGHLTLRP
jgi:hypothetical protein